MLDGQSYSRHRPHPPQVIGRARILPGQAWHSPGIDPETWYSVLDGNPEVSTPALEGYMWIEHGGRRRHVWAAHFELRTDSQEPRSLTEAEITLLRSLRRRS
jgi:hypothetical protein